MRTVDGSPNAHLTVCARHWAERAVGRCGDCGDAFCPNCLVVPTRRGRPVRCIECALIAGGVRTKRYR